MAKPNEVTIDSLSAYTQFLEKLTKAQTDIHWFRGVGDSSHKLIRGSRYQPQIANLQSGCRRSETQREIRVLLHLLAHLELGIYGSEVVSYIGCLVCSLFLRRLIGVGFAWRLTPETLSWHTSETRSHACT